MDNFDYSDEGLISLDYDPRSHQFAISQALTWPSASMGQALGRNHAQDVNVARPRANTMQAGSMTDTAYSQAMSAATTGAFMAEHWPVEMSQLSQPTYIQATGFDASYQMTYGGEVQTSPVALIPTSSAAFSSAPLASNLASMPLDASYMSMPPANIDPMNQFAYLQLNNYQDGYEHPSMYNNLPSAPIGQPFNYGSSPSDSLLEVRSLSSSDNGWANIDYRQSGQIFDTYPENSTGAIFNPGATLHHRTVSEASLQSDGAVPDSANSVESFEEVFWPVSSPASETNFEFPQSRAEPCLPPHQHFESNAHYQYQLQQPIPTSNTVSQLPATYSFPSSASTSPASTEGSLVLVRRKESPASKVVKKKTTTTQKRNKDMVPERKLGKRRGPLLPEQRARAGKIRKIKACLRCKYLKKVCDEGDPCGGCQPAHTRLWQVPCTRIDIKDIGYFMKDWKADYERHVSLGFSIANIRGWSPHETPVKITHGYGQYLRIAAREVYVNDENCFGMDWMESRANSSPTPFEVQTGKLTAGRDGISLADVDKYLDNHVDQGFEKWIDDYFEHCPFVTEMLKTAYRYYRRSNLPVVRKALKLVLAYNLTLHVTLIEGVGEGELPGKIDNETSRYHGKIMAPVMINFQIKDAMGKMWRELQKQVLEELSSLYSGVYSGERPRNWPIIFILGMILLIVWELMQFDCHYRVTDKEAVAKFCNDMESVPVGVVVGLFFAISQRFPVFTQWDSREHGKFLGENRASCDTMSEVREHVTKYEGYLKNRSNCRFDRDNFDSLSSKFLSKLVLRAN